MFAQYTIFHDQRDELRARCNEQGIPTAVHYPIPLNEQKAYEIYGQKEATPIARELAKRVISLPMSAYLTEPELNRVCAVVEEACN